MYLLIRFGSKMFVRRWICGVGKALQRKHSYQNRRQYYQNLVGPLRVGRNVVPLHGPEEGG